MGPPCCKNCSGRKLNKILFFPWTILNSYVILRFVLWVWIKSCKQDEKTSYWKSVYVMTVIGLVLNRNLWHPITKKNPNITAKCSFIPLSHLMKIGSTTPRTGLPLIWQQDNHGRQMASNSITGAGHVMSTSLLTLTGCTRCWQTYIDPGNPKCWWCIIV